MEYGGEGRVATCRSRRQRASIRHLLGVDEMARSFALIAAASAALVVIASSDSRAADLGAQIRPGAVAAGAAMQLNCDNGRVYPIRPRAVSEVGELVTGYISTAPRRTHHFRLIPMGNGYRYAGHGFWFDGIRLEATLIVDSRETACTVEYS
jgi:hypothetical protein